MPQQMPRPPELPILDADWENTPKSVQLILTEREKQIQQIRRRSQRLAWAGFGIAAVVTTILLGFSVIVFRPYARLARLRSQAEQVVCVYREPMLYTVRPRDTLFGISVRYEVPVSVLASANDIRDVNSIDIGDELFIPDSVCVAPGVNTRIADDYGTATSIYLSATPTLKEEQYQATETRAAVLLAETDAFWETVTAVSTPPDLTRTTATPVPAIGELELTATYIIGRATQESKVLTATASH